MGSDSYYKYWARPTITPPPKKKECECGLNASIKAGGSGGLHQWYCPLHEGEKK